MAGWVQYQQMVLYGTLSAAMLEVERRILDCAVYAPQRDP